MTIFTRTWDGTYIATPANTEDARLGAQRVRETRVDVEERMAVDHFWGGDEFDGEHVKVTFKAQIANPTAVADKGFLYTKDVSAKVELFFLDEDGDAVQLTSGGAVNVTPVTPYVVPAGITADYAGAAAPTGWLLCFGQAISRTAYADLFTAIGTVFGVGDGSTTFNLPDLRGRVTAGKDNMGGTSANRLTDQSGGLNGDTLGDTGGAETHQLILAELPSYNLPTTVMTGDNSIYTFSGGGTGQFNTVPAGGSDIPHNNVQPTIILNKIISTGGV
jgi:microcystin-dependent protein